MTFAPGSFSRIDSARSAVTKSPGTNSPVSSTKKHRSASPSKATPRSALSSSVFRTMNSRFSGRSGFGSWFGKVPSGAEEQRAAADDLHARVLLRVVRGGDLDPAVEAEVADGEVEHLGADEPELEDVYAGLRGAADGRRGHGRRGDAHVPADGDLPRLELLRVGAADRVRALLVELVGIDPADVVGLEHLRIEHARMLSEVQI